MINSESYIELVNNYATKHPNSEFKNLLIEDYKERMQRLTEFSERVKDLIGYYGIENLNKKETFKEFMTLVVGLDEEIRNKAGQKPSTGYYGEADTNLLKPLYQLISNEDIWRVKKELYQDPFLSLGLFCLRYSQELSDFLQDIHFYSTEYPADFPILKDREQMIVSAWNIGNTVIRDFLISKANNKSCINTRKILENNNLITK